MGRQPLWVWGLILIGVAVAIGAVGVMMSPGPPTTNEERGQAFGRGAVQVLALLAGGGLIVAHFVRRRKG